MTSCHRWKVTSSNNQLCIPYTTKLWQARTLANHSLQSFDEENLSKFTVALTFNVYIGKPENLCPPITILVIQLQTLLGINAAPV